MKDDVDQLVIADNQRGWQISICIDFTFVLFFCCLVLFLFTSPVSPSFYTVFFCLSCPEHEDVLISLDRGVMSCCLAHFDRARNVARLVHGRGDALLRVEVVTRVDVLRLERFVNPQKNVGVC